MPQPFRLTLTGLASQYIHMPLAPFCLRRAVEESGAALCTICDLNVNQTQEELLERILETRPDAVGICLYIWNRLAALQLARRIRAVCPEILILMGGPEATYAAEATLREAPVDYLLRGAGEESLPALLHCLQQRGDPAQIPGVCFLRDGQLHLSAPAAALPPRSDLYDDAWQQALSGRMAYVETSRGCPFACAFCLSGNEEAPDARRVQFMPQEDALQLLIRLGASGADTVKLIDRTFNCRRDRTLYLLSGLIDAKRGGRIGQVCYHLEVAADLFDDATLDLLASAPAGLFQLEAGLQSFHAPTLESCRRRTDMARLVSNQQRILAPGNVHTHIDLIAGLPREDFECFGHSFDQAYELHPHQLQLGFLKLIHGSALRQQDWGQRYAPDPPYEVLSTPWLSYAEICRLHACAEAVERLHNSGRFALTLQLALETTGMRPFALFLHLGQCMARRQGRWSLDALTAMLHGALLEMGVPADALQTAMITDRLATDNTGYLPPLLQGDAQLLKAALRQYRETHPEVRNPRGGLLPGRRVAVAAWTHKHPVTGRGAVEILPL